MSHDRRSSASRDRATEQGSTISDADGTGLSAEEAWFDPIKAGIRDRMRGFIQELLEQELTAALGRSQCERAGDEPKGYRNGTWERQSLGSFGPVAVEVPRARIAATDGGMSEWRSRALPRCARMARLIEALIAGAHSSGTNMCRVAHWCTFGLPGAVLEIGISSGGPSACRDGPGGSPLDGP